jgi:hypothetical protein
MSDDQDPLWKQAWKTEGIRYLGPDGNGAIDAMERFRHAFELGRQHEIANKQLSSMRGKIQDLNSIIA